MFIFRRRQTSRKALSGFVCALLVAAYPGSQLGLMAGGTGAPGGVQTLAEKEAAKRVNAVKEAQALLVEGGLVSDKGQWEEAMRLYREAYDSLPDAPLAAEAKLAARDGYSRAANAQALQWAKDARYAEARKLLAGVLEESFDPENQPAKKLLHELDDPDRYEPSLTPEHKAKAAKVVILLRDGGGLMRLGDYDGANKKFQEALLLDPYNQAARRNMERVEQLKSEYLDAARDHGRIVLLNKVSATWEDPVPPLDISGQFGSASPGGAPAGGRDDVLSKLKTWIVPNVELQGATLDEVMEFLRIRSRELDPQKKGISFVLKAPAELASRQITLTLTEVPLVEVLRYVTEATGTTYRLDGFAVTVTALSEKSDTLITQTYRVPPSFITNAPVGGAAAGAAPNPFGPVPGAAPEGGAMRRLGAKEFLESQGVPFPEGSSAAYNPASGLLLVRNTVPNLALVDTLVEQASSASPKQVEITVKMIDVSETRLNELGFDWLLGQFNIPGSSSTFASGGTLGNQKSTPYGPLDAPIGQGGGNTAIGENPLTAGLRGTGAILGSPSIDGLLHSSSAPAIDSKSPGIFAVSGVFTDPQFQMVLHALNNSKGVDLMASPSVVTKSGQRATVVVAREMRYPTQFNPPQMPQQLGGNIAGQQYSAPPVVPITPTTPTAFERRDVGITLEVEPVIGANGRTVDLNLAPSSVEFEGFIDYGTPIKNTASYAAYGGSNYTFDVPNKILQPIFRTNKVSTSVTVWDGNTVVLGGIITETRQDIKDKVPVLGDIPLVGHAFQSRVSSTEKKAVLFFVSVKVIDPAGVRLNQPPATVAR